MASLWQQLGHATLFAQLDVLGSLIDLRRKGLLGHGPWILNPLTLLCLGDCFLHISPFASSFKHQQVRLLQGGSDLGQNRKGCDQRIEPRRHWVAIPSLRRHICKVEALLLAAWKREIDRCTLRQCSVARLPCAVSINDSDQQGSLKDTFCPVETWLFPPK